MENKGRLGSGVRRWLACAIDHAFLAAMRGQFSGGAVAQQGGGREISAVPGNLVSAEAVGEAATARRNSPHPETCSQSIDVARRRNLQCLAMIRDKSQRRTALGVTNLTQTHESYTARWPWLRWSSKS